MNSKRRSILAQWLIACTVVANLAVCPARADTLPKGKAEGNRWKAVYQGGPTPFQAETRVMVTITKDSLVLEPKKGLSFTIPAADIRAVSSSLASSHAASRAQAGVWAGAVGLSPYTVLFLPFGLAGMAATYPMKSHYAYINILWNEKGVEQEIVLRLDGRDYTPFVTELQKATGKEWKNLDAEWAKVQQQVPAEGYTMFVQLDRKVRIAKADLKPGPYQLVLLKREGNQGELYFFSGNRVDIKHLAAVAMIEIATRDDTRVDPISYKEDESGVTTFSEIRMNNKVLRFP
jgi:hypothetical protein